ncbi:MAG: hypothetical protein HY365_01235 [Candidatus Aenigmarchaeota archaeon]|nr:hypothetical protein [Candidatus Aenigmarchaeota archaeon]
MSIADAVEKPGDILWALIIMGIIFMIMMKVFAPDADFLGDKIMSLFRVG